MIALYFVTKLGKFLHLYAFVNIAEDIPWTHWLFGHVNRTILMVQ